MTIYVAKDPVTGLELRDATDVERDAYLDQPGHPSCRKPVLVGDMLINENTGPAVWYGGAGF